jgi:hypothetical protein
MILELAGEMWQRIASGNSNKAAVEGGVVKIASSLRAIDRLGGIKYMSIAGESER